MDFRIQKRKGSSNIIEMVTFTEEGKEKWIPFLAPLVPKKDGDIVAEQILRFLNEQDAR